MRLATRTTKRSKRLAKGKRRPFIHKTSLWAAPSPTHRHLPLGLPSHPLTPPPGPLPRPHPSPLAKGKRRSDDGTAGADGDDGDDDDALGAPPGKKRKVAAGGRGGRGGGGEEEEAGGHRGQETMAVLQGSDRLFAGLRKGARGLKVGLT